MSTKVVTIIDLLKEVMHRKKIHPRQLAISLTVSHASVSRWLSGKDLPSASSCLKIAEFTGVSLERILSLSGLIPFSTKKGIDLPAFREYARQKYPKELDEDIITMIEHLIEQRSRRTSDKRR